MPYLYGFWRFANAYLIKPIERIGYDKWNAISIQLLFSLNHRTFGISVFHYTLFSLNIQPFPYFLPAVSYIF